VRRSHIASIAFARIDLVSGKVAPGAAELAFADILHDLLVDVAMDSMHCSI
jgi:hypothetical protein